MSAEQKIPPINISLVANLFRLGKYKKISIDDSNIHLVENNVTKNIPFREIESLTIEKETTTRLTWLFNYYLGATVQSGRLI